MNNKTIDLHGLRSDEAIPQVLFAIEDVLSGAVNTFEIITGNGIVLKDMVIEEVEKANLHWSYNGSNQGSIIIRY